jgi:sarcosine oxidase
VVRPDATRTFLHSYARAAGATLLHNTTVLEINPDPTGVTVRTPTKIHTADHLIVTAGSWTQSLFPELHLPLTPERRVLAWFQPQQPLPPQTPIFIFDADGGWYGMPTPSGHLKLGHDKHLRQPVDRSSTPGTTASTTPPAPPNAEDAAFLSTCICNYFPGIDPTPTQLASCIYTLTPDHHFLIDRHPTHPNILLFSPCSGHGFKFAPAYGQIAADLLTGHPTPNSSSDLSQFRLNRASETGAQITRFTA